MVTFIKIPDIKIIALDFTQLFRIAAFCLDDVAKKISEDAFWTGLALFTSGTAVSIIAGYFLPPLGVAIALIFTAIGAYVAGGYKEAIDIINANKAMATELSVLYTVMAKDPLDYNYSEIFELEIKELNISEPESYYESILYDMAIQLAKLFSYSEAFSITFNRFYIAYKANDENATRLQADVLKNYTSIMLDALKEFNKNMSKIPDLANISLAFEGIEVFNLLLHLLFSENRDLLSINNLTILFLNLLYLFFIISQVFGVKILYQLFK